MWLSIIQHTEESQTQLPLQLVDWHYGKISKGGIKIAWIDPYLYIYKSLPTVGNEKEQ